MRRFSFINILFIAFSSMVCFAQESNLQSKRPLIFTKPTPLNWHSIPFESLNYGVVPIDGGASIYTLPSDSALKFSVKIVLPDTVFSYPEEDRTTYGAISNLLLQGGFGDFNFDQIQNKLAENGINLETTLNQNGQIVVAASALTQDFELVLDLIRQMLFTPRFDEKSLELWKQENKDNFTSLMDANTLEKQMKLVDNLANNLAFGENHYFSKSIKRMSPAETDKVTNEKMKTLYKKSFNRNGLNVWISGNYTQKNLNLFSKMISKIPKLEPQTYRWLPSRSLAQNSENKILTFILNKQDMTQSNVTLRYYFSNLGKLNKIEKVQAQIINEIFSSSGGIVGNDRFTKVMRSDTGISYSPFAYLRQNVVTPNTNVSAYFLNFQTPNERLAEAVGLAKQTWETFLKKGITQNELDMARTALMNRLLATENSVFNKSDDLMNQLTMGQIPNRSPIEFNLVNLDQMQDVTKINDMLLKLSQSQILPVLVIMGHPNDQQIDSLRLDKQIKVEKVIDFNSFVNSF